MVLLGTIHLVKSYSPLQAQFKGHLLYKSLPRSPGQVDLPLEFLWALVTLPVQGHNSLGRLLYLCAHTSLSTTCYELFRENTSRCTS